MYLLNGQDLSPKEIITILLPASVIHTIENSLNPNINSWVAGLATGVWVWLSKSTLNKLLKR